MAGAIFQKLIVNLKKTTHSRVFRRYMRVLIRCLLIAVLVWFLLFFYSFVYKFQKVLKANLNQIMNAAPDGMGKSS